MNTQRLYGNNIAKFLLLLLLLVAIDNTMNPYNKKSNAKNIKNHNIKPNISKNNSNININNSNTNTHNKANNNISNSNTSAHNIVKNNIKNSNDSIKPHNNVTTSKNTINKKIHTNDTVSNNNTNNTVKNNSNIPNENKNTTVKDNINTSNNIINNTPKNTIDNSNNKTKNNANISNNNIDNKLKENETIKNNVIYTKTNNNIKSNKIVSHIPIVLAKKDLEIPIIYDIDFDEPILEIKRVKNDVYLNEAKLVNKIDSDKIIKVKKGKLFLKGFIRKSIEYATADTITDTYIKGLIKNIVVYVPFKCITPINYTNFIINNFAQYFNDNNDKIHDYSNKEIHYNLEKAQILESTICTDKNQLENNSIEHIFESIKTQSILKLTLKLFQEQPVNIIK